MAGVVAGSPGDDMDSTRSGDTLARIVAFLRDIGLDVREGPVADAAFLPGVEVRGGRIVYDPARLAWPGDLLHEAGHIAITPAARRGELPGLLEGLPVDAHGGEVDATAWAYAACMALGLAPEVLFHAGGYRGHGQDLAMMYSLGVYPGAAGLARAGLTHVGGDALSQGLTCYPHMIRWLRD